MLTPQEKQQIDRQIDALQKEITEQRSTLKQLNDQKEELFSKRNPVGKQIAGSIREIKQLRKERDEITIEVKESKKKRDELTKKIKEQISKFQKSSSNKREVRVRESPRALKQQVDKMQYTIETEALSFEKEKGLMKTIRAVEKKLEEAKKIEGMWEDTKGLNKEINKLKKDADKFHKQIQEKAQAGR